MIMGIIIPSRTFILRGFSIKVLISRFSYRCILIGILPFITVKSA